MKCPNCANKLIKSDGHEIQFRIKGRVWVDTNGTHSQCYWCNSPVTLPLVMKSESPQVRAYVVIKKT